MSKIDSPDNLTPILVCSGCKKPTPHSYCGTKQVQFSNTYGLYKGAAQMFECECLRKRQFGVVDVELVARHPRGPADG